ncbi:MAG TPA: insulinase family protein [Bacteroidales bacterium]|nr:insulinase family protein [Bacteroidales bacterium]
MKSIFALFLVISLSLSTMAQQNKLTHGFRLIEKRFIKEVNADCYFFEHEKSGAKVLKIAAPDPNKTFCVAFHTIPESDAGTPHIMEHSVLNGSETFPVKSPFDIILKSSLKTFVNAFTGKDMTYYPAASMNEKDYFNLMHIYLDAVFKPLIYKDERIFRQEGWHYELNGPEDPVLYRGIVYGEMKGAYSNPVRYVNYHMYRNLFPNNGYGYESGGYPDAIPDLTWEDFKNYHAKYYHPGNSYMVLYGDADLDRELAFISEKYLSGFTRSDKPVVVPFQAPFKAMKRVEAYYPVMEGAETGKQTFLSLSFVFGEGKDQLTADAISLLARLLISGESAPVRLALQKAGIGSDVSAGVTSYQQNILQILVRNAEPQQADAFYKIVMDCLKEAAEKGIETGKMEGFINRYEFSLREDNDAQKGLTLLQEVLPSFMLENNPMPGLQWEERIGKLRDGLKSDWYNRLLEKMVITNPHALLLSVAPQPGLDAKQNQAVEEKLAQYRETLSQEQINSLMQETKDLIVYQNLEDDPAAKATLPTLSREDINPKASYHQALLKNEGKNQVLHYETFTNNVLYTNLMFDLRVLAEEDLPYASLLSELLSSLNTTNFSYALLDEELNKHTGGFSAYLNRYLENQDDHRIIPFFVASAKATAGKADKMFTLTEEILLWSLYNDPERIKTLITRHMSQLEASLKADGSGISSTRLRSYHSADGVFDEITGGYAYYTFIKELSESLDERMPELMQRLTTTARKLFVRENLTIGITCSREDYPVFTRNLNTFITSLPSGKPVKETWKLNPEIRNEGFLTASRVQYVNMGANFRKLGYAWDGSLMVLNLILSRDYLNQQIRVVGGAYGGYSTITSNGNISMISYRDPNFSKTLETYRATVDFLENFEADEKAMTQYIIGTIARLDQPLRVSQQGDRAFHNYFTGLQASDYQKERDEVLNTTEEEIKAYAALLRKVTEQDMQCTYGNAATLEAGKDQFKNLIRI